MENDNIMEVLYTKEQYESIKQLWDEFKEDIKYGNRFFAGEEIIKILDKIKLIRNLGFSIPGDSIYYRARIGDFIGENDIEMLAPPRGKANSGRCNPNGMSYLYLADNIETAISEVKPNKGDIVTIAAIKYKYTKVFAFDALDDLPIPLKRESIKDPEFEALINIISNDLSTVITVDKVIDYLPFQFLTEYLKKKRLDGFSYRSTLSESGFNYVFFNASEAKVVFKNSYKIDDIKYYFSPTT